MCTRSTSVIEHCATTSRDALSRDRTAAPSLPWSTTARLIDHASDEAWCDASLRTDRFAAANLLREVCTEHFGSVEQAVAAGESGSVGLLAQLALAQVVVLPAEAEVDDRAGRMGLCRFGQTGT